MIDPTLPGLRHIETDVDGTRLHSVTLGAGPAVVLVAGWPEWWWTWRHVIAALAPYYTVHAVDLRGQGASDKPHGGYDIQTVADELARWVQRMDLHHFVLVGHDVGTWVSFAYAASWGERLAGVVLSDALIPGVGDPPPGETDDATNIMQWQFSFNRLPELPELLVRGHEREFIAWMFRYKSKRFDRIGDDVIDAFAATLTDADTLRAGFDYYRALPETRRQAKELVKNGLTMPVLTIGAGAGVGHRLQRQLESFASQLDDATIEDGGHYLSEENPDQFVAAMRPFLDRVLLIKRASA